jgi:DNA-binding NtrC family response regulator
MKNIVIVDDDLLFCEIARDQFSAAYNIVVFNHGSEAFEFIKNNTFDLLITDILLPGQDGFEIIQMVKDEKKTTKVIAVSGGGSIASESYLDLAKRFGVDYTYSKQSPITELTEIVNDIL